MGYALKLARMGGSDVLLNLKEKKKPFLFFRFVEGGS
jgi:hypothetical protein